MFSRLHQSKQLIMRHCGKEQKKNRSTIKWERSRSRNDYLTESSVRYSCWTLGEKIKNTWSRNRDGKSWMYRMETSEPVWYFSEIYQLHHQHGLTTTDLVNLTDNAINNVIFPHTASPKHCEPRKLQTSGKARHLGAHQFPSPTHKSGKRVSVPAHRPRLQLCHYVHR